MEILIAVIPAAMLSFYAGLFLGAVRGEQKHFTRGVKFGRKLERQRLNSYRTMGVFKPEFESIIDLDYQLTEEATHRD